MNTFGNIIAAKEKEGEARGLELGKVQGLELGKTQGLELGRKEILMQFVAEFWSDDEAARFAQKLDGADHSQIPAIADLMRDQAAGRLPRLRQNSRTEAGK